MQQATHDITSRAPLMVRIKHARALLGGISNTTIWKWIAEGHVEVVYVNKMPFVTTDSINKLAAATRGLRTKSAAQRVQDSSSKRRA